MIEIALVTRAIGAASAGLKLIDEIADQVTYYVRERKSLPAGAADTPHAMTIEAGDGEIVANLREEITVVTAAELETKLSQSDLRHVKVLEQAMETHYKVWARVYPQLGAMNSPIQRSKVEEQLDAIVQDMKKSLVGILDFIERCGFQLDDHYWHVRDVVASA